MDHFGRNQSDTSGKHFKDEEGNVLFVENNEPKLWEYGSTITVYDRNEHILRSDEYEEQEALEYMNDEEIPTVQVINESEVMDNPQDDTPEGRKVWSCDHTKALITAVETRYDDLCHVVKKKTFWNKVSNELISQNIEYSEIVCKKKWANLIRSYKAAKGKKEETGKGPTKFPFFEQLDALLGDAPTNGNPHTINVALLNNDDNDGESTSSVSINEKQNEPSVSPTSVSRKRKNPTSEHVKYNEKYYENKEARAANRDAEQKLYQEKKLSLMQERNAMLRENNEIKRRKVEVLKQFLDDPLFPCRGSCARFGRSL